MLYVSPAAIGVVIVMVPVGVTQSVCVVVTVGAGGAATMVTSICDLGPSHAGVPPVIWLTQYDVVPEVAVDGVGAVANPVPPVAIVYHNNVLPAEAVAV